MISRIDLADATTPERLVLEIFKHEPDLKIPVPIEVLCKQLDIFAIIELKTSGYEGGLITDPDKHTGTILYNKASPRRRRRFTIAHELGHFLMPSHIPSDDGKFLCSQADFFSLSRNELDRRLRMEAEANRFAAHILLPAHYFRKDVAATKEPTLDQVRTIAEKYDVSLEVAGRSYVNFRAEPCAFILTHNFTVLRSFRHQTDFPYISVPWGSPVPRQSVLLRRHYHTGEMSEVEETDAGVWIDVQRGTKAPQLYEQVLVQSNGYAVILLFLEHSDEEESDSESELTSKERYRWRLDRYER